MKHSIKLKQGKKSKSQFALYAKIDWEKASKIFQRIPSNTGEKHSYPSIKVILHILAAAGVAGAIFAFPGAAPALGALVLGKDSYDRWRTKQIVSQMAKQKLLKIEEHDDGTVTVKITKQGMIRALTYQLDSMRLIKPKKWDRRWRVVIFDIPEKYKKVRDVFRMRLKQLGLYQLQKSVFASPYRCFDEIEFLRELYGVAITVRYLLVEKIEDDVYLRSHFELE